MASEMESATVFIVAAIRGKRAGALMAYEHMNENTIKTAIGAIEKLIKTDRMQSEK